MKKRVLGKDLEVSAVSLGCMGFTHAYGPAMDEKEAARVIEQAVDMGYLYFDTAECYTGNREDGSIAYNEDLVGEALRPYRKNVVIASKFGVDHSPQGLVTDSRPETVPIPGSRKAERVRENAGEADIELTAQEVEAIDEKLNHMEISGVFGGSAVKK